MSGAQLNGVIGVNLLWLVPGVVGGSEEYTVRLLRALDRLGDDEIDVRIYCRPDLIEAHPDLAGRFETITAPRVMSTKAVRIAAENSWLARMSRNDDALHHAGGVAPVRPSKPYVLTIHDLQPLDMPENFGPLRRSWLNTMLGPSVRRAALTICPSQFTRASIIRHLDEAEQRVRVVPHGHDPADAGPVDAGVRQANNDRFGRFLLYPGIAYAHKRHVDAVEVLDALRDSHPDVSLVFTSREGPEAGALRAMTSERNLADRVHWLGRVSEEELDGLYRTAAALLFTSSYEGFGNPALEAMARACPVISTTAGSIPEVVGDAGLLSDVGDIAALVAATRSVLDDAATADRLREAGPVRAARFGWQQAGAALLQAYRDTLSSIAP